MAVYNRNVNAANEVIKKNKSSLDKTLFTHNEIWEKIIYIDNNLDCQKILEINIDDDGDFLTEWPEGFFEERMNELYGGDPLGGNVNWLRHFILMMMFLKMKN